MKHTCSICGRQIDCDGEECDYPDTYPMNCNDGTKFLHQDEYLKAIEK